jgi:catechol 2,3-dioxygenase-like lactoylglutathione lyase family enzyme
VRPTSVTVGIPVCDLAAATEWYDAVLDRRPALETVPGVVAFFEFFDPDGNRLSCYHVLGDA